MCWPTAHRVSTDNVLVIKAKQHYGKIFHGGGHDEPLHDIIKTSGKFYYFNRGRYVTGTWRKGKVPRAVRVHPQGRKSAQDGARADLRRTARHRCQAAHRGPIRIDVISLQTQ